MTDGLHIFSEMLGAEILGRRILGWDYDHPNDTAYLYLEREDPRTPPVYHLVGPDALRLGNWTDRLRALDALGAAPVAAAALSPIQKLAAWFRGRRSQGTAMVQKGGAR